MLIIAMEVNLELYLKANDNEGRHKNVNIG